jgi:hypothetical protein
MIKRLLIASVLFLSSCAVETRHSRLEYNPYYYHRHHRQYNRPQPFYYNRPSRYYVYRYESSY